MISVPLFDIHADWLATVRIAEPAGSILFQGRVFIKHGDREYHEATNTRILEVLERRDEHPSPLAFDPGWHRESLERMGIV